MSEDGFRGTSTFGSMRLTRMDSRTSGGYSPGREPSPRREEYMKYSSLLEQDAERARRRLKEATQDMQEREKLWDTKIKNMEADYEREVREKQDLMELYKNQLNVLRRVEQESSELRYNCGSQKTKRRELLAKYRKLKTQIQQAYPAQPSPTVMVSPAPLKHFSTRGTNTSSPLPTSGGASASHLSVVDFDDTVDFCLRKRYFCYLVGHFLISQRRRVITGRVLQLRDAVRDSLRGRYFSTFRAFVHVTRVKHQIVEIQALREQLLQSEDKTSEHLEIITKNMPTTEELLNLRKELDDAKDVAAELEGTRSRLKTFEQQLLEKDGEAKQLNALQNAVAEKDNTIESSLHAIAQHELTIASLKGTIETLQADLLGHSSTQEQKVNTLTVDLDDAHRQKKQLADELEKAREETASLHDANQQLEEKLAASQQAGATNTELANEVKALRAKLKNLDDMQQQFSENQAAADKLKIEQQYLTEEIENLQQQNDELKDAGESLTKDVENLQQQSGELKDANENLAEEVENLQQQNDELKGARESLAEEVKNLKDANESLTEKVENLQQQNDEKQAKTDETHAREIEANTEKINSLTAELEAAQRQTSILEEDRERLEGVNQDTSDQLAAVQEKLDQNISEMKEQTVKVDEEQERRAEMCQDLEAENETLRKTQLMSAASYKEELADLQAQLESVVKGQTNPVELAQLKNEAEQNKKALEQALETLEEEKTAAGTQIENLAAELREEISRKQEFESLFTQSELERNNMKSVIDTLTEQHINLTDSLSHATDAYKTKLSTLSHALRKIKKSR